MNRISLDRLLNKTDSRYSLTVATAKRAREITDELLEKADKDSENTEPGHKAVSIALEEIANDIVRIVDTNKKK